MSELISIVIPTFNKQSTLLKCLQSIQRQTYSDIEVWIIDDCSSDSSRDIANEFISQDNRFRLIANNENIGHLKSRYRGIDLVSGRFTTFVDADDWIEPEAVERMASAQQKFDTDIVQMRFQRRFKGIARKYNEVYNPELSNRRIDGEEFRILASYVGMDSYIQPPYWAKLYKTEILRETGRIEFEQFWGEDQIFNIQYLRSARSIAFLDYVGYNYRWGGETSTNYKFSALKEYKHVHCLKRLLGQDERCINEEIISLLRYHIRQLITETGWTREATIAIMEEELHDPLWQKAGLTENATELVNSECNTVQSNPLKYIIKRLLR